jgi:hypothetical protein
MIANPDPRELQGLAPCGRITALTSPSKRILGS